VTFTNTSDIGQGTGTAIARILADELDLAWQNVRLEMAPNGSNRPGIRSPRLHSRPTNPAHATLGDRLYAKRRGRRGAVEVRIGPFPPMVNVGLEATQADQTQS